MDDLLFLSVGSAIQTGQCRSGQDKQIRAEDSRTPRPEKNVSRVASASAGRAAAALSLPARLAEGEGVRVRAERLGMTGQTLALAPGAEGATADFTLEASALALDALVVTGTGGSGAEEETAWRGAGRAEAERRLRRPVVVVAQLPLLGMEVGEVEGTPVVRVRQSLPGGEVLTLVQRGATRARVPPGGAARRAGAEAGTSRLTLERGGLVIEASAPIPADSLRALLLPGRKP